MLKLKSVLKKYLKRTKSSATKKNGKSTIITEKKLSKVEWVAEAIQAADSHPWMKLSVHLWEPSVATPCSKTSSASEAVAEGEQAVEQAPAGKAPANAPPS